MLDTLIAYPQAWLGPLWPVVWTLAKIVAAGRTPGMPATADTVGEAVARGCRYIYTHLPRLIGAGAAAFLRAAR